MVQKKRKPVKCTCMHNTGKRTNPLREAFSHKNKAIRLVQRNMCSNGVYQLKKILLKYSETGHSSRNVRFFLRFILPDYKEENKHLNIEIQHEQYEEPLAIFEYINNSRYEISLKDIKSKHIVDIINLYKDSAGNSNFLKHGGPKVYSNKRSIQVKRKIKK